MEKFKKFWVKSVNNYLCDADYNGNRLKNRNPVPSFRRFYYIRSWEELNHFHTREEATNFELVNLWLSQCEN